VSAPDVVTARNLVALALAQQGHLDSAVAELQAALSNDPENPDLHGNLAYLLLQQRKFERAREHYEAYLARRQGNAVVLTGLGNALGGLGRSSDAMKAYREAVAFDPRYTEARARLEQLTSK
jgi:Tfp pilus assembly protein PilF